jgi:low affinity Fe/Cu permease
MSKPSEGPRSQTPEQHRWFAEFANAASRASGRAITFALAVLVILVWAITGPLFGFSDTWQLIINTSTTIQVKLDELIRTGHVRNRFVGIEHLSDDEIEALRKSTEARAAHEGSRRAVKRIDDRARRAADDVSHG